MRPEKRQVVEEVRSQMTASPYVLFTDYHGMTVTQFAELRRRLLTVNAECHVVKNRILKRAIEAAEMPRSNGSFIGMTAVVTGGDRSDISAAARVIRLFSKEFEKPKFKLGFVGEELLTFEELVTVAGLPSLDVLRARLLCMLRAPATNIAVILGAPASQIARVLKARADKG